MLLSLFVLSSLWFYSCGFTDLLIMVLPDKVSRGVSELIEDVDETVSESEASGLGTVLFGGGIRSVVTIPIDGALSKKRKYLFGK